MRKRNARGGTRSKGSSFLKVLKIVIALGSIPVIILAAILIYYYYVFDRAINEKLGNRTEIAGTEIYAAPGTIYPGKPISTSEFVEQLHHLGYAENSAAGSRERMHVPGGQEESHHCSE